MIERLHQDIIRIKALSPCFYEIENWKLSIKNLHEKTSEHWYSQGYSKTYFKASTKPEILEIEPAQFLSIVGKGDPSDKQFADKIEALYSTAYTLKFAYKAKDKDFVVSKLEGLWWFDEKKFANKTIVNTSIEVPRSEWEYRLLIMLPDFITKQDLERAKETVIAKKGIQLARQLEYFTMAEGKSIQMLHVGPLFYRTRNIKTNRRICGN